MVVQDRPESTFAMSSPESLLVAEIANDPEASVQYDQNMPHPYVQPHVEAAFQAQFTNKRVTVLFGAGVLKSFGALMYGLVGLSDTSKSDDWGVPPLGWLVVGLLWSVYFAVLICGRNSMRTSHSFTQTMTNIVLFLVTIQAVVTNVMYCMYPRPDRDPQHPYHMDYEMHLAVYYYIAGMYFSGLIFVQAHVAAPLWMFSLNLMYAASVTAYTNTVGSVEYAVYMTVVSVAGEC